MLEFIRVGIYGMVCMMAGAFMVIVPTGPDEAGVVLGMVIGIAVAFGGVFLEAHILEKERKR